MRETDLSNSVAVLERQLSCQKADMFKLTIELQSAKTNVTLLQQVIDDMSSRCVDNAHFGGVALSSESIHNRFQEMEDIAIELTHRAESAEKSLHMLIAAEPSCFESAAVPKLVLEVSSFETACVPATMDPDIAQVDIEFISSHKSSMNGGHTNFNEYDYNWQPPSQNDLEDRHTGSTPHFEQNGVPLNVLDGQIVKGTPSPRTSSRAKKKVKDAAPGPRAVKRLTKVSSSNIAVSEVQNCSQQRSIAVDKSRCSGPPSRVARSQNISLGSDCRSLPSEVIIRIKEKPSIAQSRSFIHGEKSRMIKECSRTQFNSQSVPLMTQNPRKGEASVTATMDSARVSLAKRKMYRRNSLDVRHDIHGDIGLGNRKHTTESMEIGRTKRKGLLSGVGKRQMKVPSSAANSALISQRERISPTVGEKTGGHSMQVRHKCVYGGGSYQA